MGEQQRKVKRERGGSSAKERISKMAPCTAGKRSSIYRGVTRHRWTGRYEAHLWDKTTWNQNQNKKGKQVYLGAYDDEEAAARAYDLAALKYWGPATLINFPVTDYTRDLHEMQNVSRQDYLASLRRKTSAFSRPGFAKYPPLSTWDSSLRRPPASLEDEPGFSMERKIDLTPHIKWWGINKIRHSDVKHSSCLEEVGTELKSMERGTQPYQMPDFGTCFQPNQSKASAPSAFTILSTSAAYKNMQERASKLNPNDDKDNKSYAHNVDYGNPVEKPTVVSMGGLPLHKSSFPLTAPLLTNYSTMDPLGDPILWTSLMPVPPSEVTKTESSFFRQEG